MYRRLKYKGNVKKSQTSKKYIIFNKECKKNLEEVNIEKVKKEFKNFLKLHNEEIERIKKVI